MTGTEFDKILKHILDHCDLTLANKRAEYATEDRLHNFKVAAQLQNGTPEEALLGMMTKHVVSIYDMVLSREKYLYKKWDEKIGDAINYLILLRALVEETGRSGEPIIEPFTNELNDALFNSISIMMEDGTYCHSPNTTKRGPTSDLNYYCFWEDERKKQCDNCQYHVAKAYNKVKKSYPVMRKIDGTLIGYCHSPAWEDDNYCYWNDVDKKYACEKCNYCSA